MAKKRSKMSLKDFHGGVIPTDLQLPSAPGMSVDRGTYERHQGTNVWNNNRGYGGDRGRQGSANGFRSFEDKASYFVNNGANIGRNFDEDERRPVDYRPRSSPGNEGSLFDRHDKPYDSRTSDRFARDFDKHNRPGRPLEQFQQQPSAYQGGGRFGVQQGSAALPTTPPEKISAWGARDQQRETGVSSLPGVRTSVARIAEASAIDKVSSGRWQPGIITSGGLERSTSADDVSRSMLDELRRVENLQITHGSDLDDGGRKGYPSPWTQQAVERVHEHAPGRHVEHGGALHGGVETSVGRIADVPDVRGPIDPYRRGYPGGVEDRYPGSGRQEYNRSGYDRLEVHGDAAPDMRNASVNHPYYMDDPPAAVFLEKFNPGGLLDWERSRFVQANQQSVPSSAIVHSNQQQPSTAGMPTAIVHSNQQQPSTAGMPSASVHSNQHQPSTTGMQSAHSNQHQPSTTGMPSASVQSTQQQPLPLTRGDSQRSWQRGRHQHEQYETGTLHGRGDREQDAQRVAAERPKLNLKPRSQLSDGIASSNKERQTLFGGARPRELVLKERGVDDVTIAGLETDSEANRGLTRPDSRQGGRGDARNGKSVKSELVRSESDRYDVRREQQQEVRRDLDRRDSWRRPAADPTASVLAEMPSRASARPYAGATSAIELAQTFSRLTTSTTRYSNTNNNNNKQRTSDKAAW